MRPLSTDVPLSEVASAGYRANAPLREYVALPRASAVIVHRRAGALLAPPEVVYNVITTVGRDFLHTQGYAASGIAVNGLNYIGLSSTTLTETSASTTLSGEITGNGLQRAQGIVAHTVGTNTTTINKVFTATAQQVAQKAALFTAVSGGTMNHALAFASRTLEANDTLEITFTITLG